MDKQYRDENSQEKWRASFDLLLFNAYLNETIKICEEKKTECIIMFRKSNFIFNYLLIKPYANSKWDFCI
jgi:hypothetical protein